MGDILYTYTYDHLMVLLCWSPFCYQNSSPICNKLRCTVYSDTFLSEPALTSLAV